jgi:hypothetical protein
VADDKEKKSAEKQITVEKIEKDGMDAWDKTHPQTGS